MAVYIKGGNTGNPIANYIVQGLNLYKPSTTSTTQKTSSIPSTPYGSTYKPSSGSSSGIVANKTYTTSGGGSGGASTPAQTYSQPVSTSSSSSGGGSSSSGSSGSSGYSVNLKAPNLKWSPTDEMRAEWDRLSQMRAENKYTPFLTSLADELADYTRQADINKSDIQSQNTASQLGLANVVQNTMKQDIIDNAIRRGATESGWLDEMLQQAGKYEVEQRTGMQKETNKALENIANALLGKQEEVSARKTDIEAAKANEMVLDTKEQELVAKNDYISNQLAKWEAQYKIAALEAQVAYQNDNLEYQYAALQAQREAENASNALQEAKLNLDKEWQNYQISKSSYTPQSTNYTYSLTLPNGQKISNLSGSEYMSAYDRFYNNANSGSGTSSLEQAILSLLQ